MEKIKFRFYDDIRNKMISWSNINKIHLHKYLSKTSDNVIPLQFVGSKDKNRKEIYEGDICKIYYYHKEGIPSVIGVVEFINNHSGFSIVVKGNCYSLNFKSGGNFGDHPAVEVIGNIYENPELLKD